MNVVNVQIAMRHLTVARRVLNPSRVNITSIYIFPGSNCSGLHTSSARCLDLKDIKKEIAKGSPQEYLKFSQSQFSPNNLKMQQEQITLEEDFEPIGRRQYVGVLLCLLMSSFIGYHIIFGEYNLELEENLQKSLGEEYVEHMKGADPQYAEKIKKLQDRRRQQQLDA